MSHLRGFLFLLVGVCSLTSQAGGKEPVRLQGHAKAITQVVFAPTGTTLATSSRDGSVRLWDPTTGKERHSFVGEMNEVLALAYRGDGRMLAWAGSDGVIRLGDPSTGKEVRRLQGHADRVAALAFSPDGKLLASGSYDGTIRLWDPDHGKEVRQLRGHEGSVTTIAFTPNGKLLASGGTLQEKLDLNTNQVGAGMADRIRLWDVATGKERAKLATRGCGLAFTPDGNHLAAGGLLSIIQRIGRGSSIDGLDQIGIVEVNSGKETRTIKWRGQAVGYAPNGKWLVTACGSNLHLAKFGMIAYNGVNGRNRDNRIRLWDTQTNQEVLRLSESQASVVAFSPDSNLLAAGTTTGVGLIWNVPAELQNPTPDPLDAIKLPPADDKLLQRLHANFEEILKNEKDPGPLREAARILSHARQGQRGLDPWGSLEGLRIIRRQRARAGIPLVLRFLVEHSRLGGFDSRPYLETLTILTGEEFSDPRLIAKGWDNSIREAVQTLVDQWWQANQDLITTDLGKMSPAQLDVVVEHWLAQIVQGSHEDGRADGIRKELDRILDPDAEHHPRFATTEMHAAMVPLLLARAGYRDKPPEKRNGRSTVRLAYEVIAPLSWLSKTGEAAELQRIARDPRQESATRLVCWLALIGAGAKVSSAEVLAFLDKEKPLERRIVAILTLGRCTDQEASWPALLQRLDDPNVHLRMAALYALERHRPKEALPGLKRLLADTRPEADVLSTLDLVAAIGTRAGQEIVADFLEATLNEPEKAEYLWHAVKAFEQMTKQRWLEPGAQHDRQFRAAARKALAWWRQLPER